MKPLKVSFKLKTPAAVEKTITLDKIVMAVVCGRTGFARTSNCDKKVISEIIKEQDGIFAASCVFAEMPIVFRTFDVKIAPNVDRQMYLDYSQSIGMKSELLTISGANSGEWKKEFTTFATIFANNLYFYTFADKDKLSDVLKRVNGIGKKNKNGLGAVVGFTIEEISEDKSIQLNEYTPSRPLPVDFGIKTDRVALYNLYGPSWDRSGLEPCIMPPIAFGEILNKEPREPVYYLEDISATRFTAKYHPELFMNETEKFKNLKFKKNISKLPCAGCGCIEEDVVDTNEMDIKKIASSSYTDFMNFDFSKSRVLCKYCAAALTNSYLTKANTLITKNEIIGGKDASIFSLLTNSQIDSDEYICIAHKGGGSSKKQILIGSLPSISPAVIAVNSKSHTTKFVDRELFLDVLKIIKRNNAYNLKNINIYKPNSENNKEIYEEVYSKLTPSSALMLNFIGRKEIELTKEVV